MADDIFEHPRLVSIYDALDPDRSDLDAYLAIADEIGARRALDIGCGTGTLAMMDLKSTWDQAARARSSKSTPVPKRPPSPRHSRI